jgi:hypothetical protein
MSARPGAEGFLHVHAHKENEDAVQFWVWSDC